MTLLTTNQVIKQLKQGLSLQKAELSHIDLQGLNLDKADFAHAYLRNANLS
ncbi:MAG: pentapeptide repeat-containing protein, partial [Moorea sp. SIO3G5]|nr:pentapeptide repeat-containing protein [Moorena sp. SIO3G5]